MGLVQDAFSAEQLAKLPGRMAIGHVRYSTAGGSHLRNAQPFAVDYAKGSLAVCHNGNLTNADELRAELEAAGSIFSSTSDSEVFVHLVARSKEIAFEDQIVDALSRASRAPTRCSSSRTTPSSRSAIRAAFVRSASASCRSRKDAHVVASEPIAFDLIGAEYVRDVEPGEMLVIDASGIKSLRLPGKRRPSRASSSTCISPARTRASPGGASTRSARSSVAPSRASPRSMPTS